MILDHQSRLFRYSSAASDDINELLASKVQRNKDYFIKPGACYSWEASVQLEYMLYVIWGSLQRLVSCLGPLEAWPPVWGPPEDALRSETESRKTESQMTEWKGPGFESWRRQTFFCMKFQLMTVHPLFP